MAELEIKIAITPKANNLGTYEVLDLISIGGRAYLSKIDNNISPVTDTAAWEKITENTYDLAVRNGFEGTEPEWLESFYAAAEAAAQIAIDAAAEALDAQHLSEEFAEQAEDVEVVPGKFSAKHWAAKAEGALSGKAPHGYAIGETVKSLKQVETETGLKVQTNEEQIKDLVNTLSTANINNESRIATTGYETVSLPKNAIGATDIKLEGRTAENLVVNGDFRNGTTGWSFTRPADSSVVNGQLNLFSASNECSAHKTFTIPSGNKVYFKVKIIEASTIATVRANKGEGFFQLSLWSTNTVGDNSTILTSPAENTIRVIAYSSINVRAIVDNYFLVNLTTTFGAGNEPDLATCDKLFADYFEGVSSVNTTGRFKAVGKNLFNGLFVQGSVLVDGSLSPSTTSSRASNFIKVLPSTSYTIKQTQSKGTIYLRVTLYDNTGSFVNLLVSEYALTSGQSLVITTTSNAKKMLFRFYHPDGLKPSDITTCQLERGATATAYTPYTESNLFLNAGALRSTPTAKDEIRKGSNGYEKVRRTGEGTLVEKITNAADREFSSDTGYWTKGTGTLIESGLCKINALVPPVYGVLRRNNILTIGKWYRIIFEIKDYTSGGLKLWFGGASLNTTAGLNSNGLKEKYGLADGTSFLLENITGDTTLLNIDNITIKEVTAAEAIAANSTFLEVGANVLFNLATPVISPLQTAGLLTAESGGTIYQEQALADAGIYSTKLDILLTSYPIASLEEIKKISANGDETYLDISTAVIAGNGLSFTHPNLAANDLVFFTYFFNKEKVSGLTTVNTYDSRVVKLDTANGKYYRIGFTVTNGVAALAATEI